MSQSPCFVLHCNSLQQTFAAPAFFVQDWKNALPQREREFDPDFDRVCAEHFEKKFILEEPVYILGNSGTIKSNRIKLSLKPGAIPSLFGFNNVEVKSEEPSSLLLSSSSSTTTVDANKNENIHDTQRESTIHNNSNNNNNSDNDTSNSLLVPKNEEDEKITQKKSMDECTDDSKVDSVEIKSESSSPNLPLITKDDSINKQNQHESATTSSSSLVSQTHRKPGRPPKLVHSSPPTTLASSSSSLTTATITTRTNVAKKKPGRPINSATRSMSVGSTSSSSSSNANASTNEQLKKSTLEQVGPHTNSNNNNNNPVLTEQHVLRRRNSKVDSLDNPSTTNITASTSTVIKTRTNNKTTTKDYPVKNMPKRRLSRRCRLPKDQMENSLGRRNVRPRMLSMPTEDQIKKKKMVARIVKSYEKKSKAKLLNKILPMGSPIKPRRGRRKKDVVVQDTNTANSNISGSSTTLQQQNQRLSSCNRKLYMNQVHSRATIDPSSSCEPTNKKGKHEMATDGLEKVETTSSNGNTLSTKKLSNNPSSVSPGNGKRKCFVLSCLQRCSKLFRAPTDNILLSKWVKNIPTREKPFAANDWICADHFESSHIKKSVLTSKGTTFTLPTPRWTLKSDQAIPTIFRTPQIICNQLHIRSIDPRFTNTTTTTTTKTIITPSQEQKLSNNVENKSLPSTTTATITTTSNLQTLNMPFSTNSSTNNINNNNNNNNMVVNKVAKRRARKLSSSSSGSEYIPETELDDDDIIIEENHDPISISFTSPSLPTYTCIVPGCFGPSEKSTPSKNTTVFHSFPTEPFRNLWVREISRKTGVNIISTDDFLNKSKVCDLHFANSDYVSNSRLKPLKKTAVPSKFKESVVKSLSSSRSTKNSLTNFNENSDSDLEITYEKMIPVSVNDKKGKKNANNNNNNKRKSLVSSNNKSSPISIPRPIDIVLIKTEKKNDDKVRMSPKKPIVQSQPPPKITTMTAATLKEVRNQSEHTPTRNTINQENFVENSFPLSPLVLTSLTNKIPASTIGQSKIFVVFRGNNAKMQVLPYKKQAGYKISRVVIVPEEGKFRTPLSDGEVILVSSDAKRIIFACNNENNFITFKTEKQCSKQNQDLGRQEVEEISRNSHNNLGASNVQNIIQNSVQYEKIPLNDKKNRNYTESNTNFGNTSLKTVTTSSNNNITQEMRSKLLFSNPVLSIPNNHKPLCGNRAHGGAILLPYNNNTSKKNEPVNNNNSNIKNNNNNNNNTTQRSKPKPAEKSDANKNKNKTPVVIQQQKSTVPATTVIEPLNPEKLVVDRKKKIPVLDQVFSWKSFLKLPSNDAWSINLLTGKLGQQNERFIFISELVVRDGNLKIQRVLKIKEDLSYNVFVNDSDFTTMFNEDEDREKISTYSRLQELIFDLAAFNVCNGLEGFSCVPEIQAQTIGQKKGDFWFSDMCDILCVDTTTCSSCLSLVEKLINIRNRIKKPSQSNLNSNNTSNSTTLTTMPGNKIQTNQVNTPTTATMSGNTTTTTATTTTTTTTMTNQQQQHYSNLPYQSNQPLFSHPHSQRASVSSTKINVAPAVSVTFNQVGGAHHNQIIVSNNQPQQPPRPSSNLGMLTNFVINQNQKPVNINTSNTHTSTNTNINNPLNTTGGGGVIVVPKVRHPLPSTNQTNIFDTNNKTTKAKNSQKSNKSNNSKNSNNNNNNNNTTTNSNNSNHNHNLQRPPPTVTPIQPIKAQSPHPNYGNFNPIQNVNTDNTPLFQRSFSKSHHEMFSPFPTPSPSSTSSSSSVGLYNYGHDNENHSSSNNSSGNISQNQMSQQGNYPVSISTTPLPRTDLVFGTSPMNVNSTNNNNDNISLHNQSPVYTNTSSSQFVLEPNQLITTTPISSSSHSQHQQQSNIYYYQPIHFQSNIYGGGSPMTQPAPLNTNAQLPATNYNFEVYTPAPTNNLPNNISSNSGAATMAIPVMQQYQQQAVMPPQQIPQLEQNTFHDHYTNTSLVHHFPTFPVPPPLFPYPNHFTSNQQ